MLKQGGDRSALPRFVEEEESGVDLIPFSEELAHSRPEHVVGLAGELACIHEPPRRPPPAALPCARRRVGAVIVLLVSYSDCRTWSRREGCLHSSQHSPPARLVWHLVQTVALQRVHAHCVLFCTSLGHASHSKGMRVIVRRQGPHALSAAGGAGATPSSPLSRHPLSMVQTLQRVAVHPPHAYAIAPTGRFLWQVQHRDVPSAMVGVMPPVHCVHPNRAMARGAGPGSSA